MRFSFLALAKARFLASLARALMPIGFLAYAVILAVGHHP